MGNLVSLTEVKSYLQITNTLTDTLIDMYVESVEAEVDAYTDRVLARGTYTEVVDYLQSRFDKSEFTPMNAGPSAPDLFLTNYPIVTITSVISGGNTVTQDTYTYDSQNGVLSPDSQLDQPTVTYVAGYTTVTAPAALQLVIMQGVSSLYTNNRAASQGSGNVKSKSIKDFSVSYGNEQTGYVTLSNGKLVKNYIASNSVILDRYKRVNI